MNEEEKELLLRVAKLSEDNHRILRKMERGVYWARVWSLVRLLLILAPLILGYIYLRPFLDKINEIYSDLNSFGNFNANSTSTLFNSEWAKGLLDQLRGGAGDQ